jgi:arsenate reductase
MAMQKRDSMMSDDRLDVLVLCTGNSCRSQMAEGWLNALYGDRIIALSAGSAPSGYVHPGAIEAMHEVGIDISEGRSKSMEEFLGREFDYVLTVCDSAAEACPVFPGPAKRVHRDFTDPAKAEGSDEEVMAVFRRVRDEIREWLGDLFDKE